jgi:lipopolysaccharide export system protein LptC
MARRSGVSGAVAEPIAGTEPKVKRDWTARTRDTAMHALRYSRFVGVMKRILPVTAGLLIAVVIVYALVPRQSDKLSLATQEVDSIKNDLTMTKPKLTGADRKGNPFVITAESAVQDPHNMRRATLNTVEADITLEKDRWLSATAATGFVDIDKGTLKLNGGIAVYSDDGYEIHTAKADVDLKKGKFHGPETVTGHGPMGSFRADTFDVNRSTNQIELHGHVQMSLEPAARK